MTLTETLFGGLLAVVLVFFIGRRLGLSNYWSGILGGLLPFLAYLGFSARAWPGGDVLAIHLVVFMATAAVLGVFGSIRKKKERMHWAPRLIIAFFVLLVIFNAALLSIATHGLPDAVSGWFLPNQGGQTVHTGFSGVIPHDRNKLYEEHQQRIEEQRNLGWQVDVQGLDALKSDVAATIKATVRDAQGRPLVADRAQLGFWRMANSKDDRTLELQAVGAGEYQSGITLPDPGRWVVELRIEHGKDVFHTRHSVLVGEPE